MSEIFARLITPDQNVYKEEFVFYIREIDEDKKTDRALSISIARDGSFDDLVSIFRNLANEIEGNK